ncbi:MAG: hypothetical protein ABIK96_08265 [bacterium]
MHHRANAAVLAAALILASPPAGADGHFVLGGYTRADVGLADDGDGFCLGVGTVAALGDGPLEILAAAEFLQLGGSQTMLFSDPQAGNTVGPAEVTLSYLQPAGSLAIRLPAGPVIIRPYAGLAAALKVGESWSTPTGTADRDLGYEDVDLRVHLGARLNAGKGFLDARYAWGLLDQVTVTGALPDKADDPLGGESLPVAGDKVSFFRVSAGWNF